MHLDLNAEPLPEEEPTNIAYSCVTSPTGSSSDSGGNCHLSGDRMESCEGSSTRDAILISHLSTPSGKRTSSNRRVEQRTSKSLYGVKKSHNLSNQQASGASPEGKTIIENLDSNQFRSREIGKAPMEEAQAAIHGNSHRLESSKEDGSSGYFSTVDWNYVIVEQDQGILNQEYYESVAIHDQKELFGFLNRLIKETKNRMENFWIERGHEFNFFKAFNTNVRANGQLSYPADSVMGAGRRISATQSTILKIYKKNVPPETGMAFLDKNQILWDCSAVSTSSPSFELKTNIPTRDVAVEVSSSIYLKELRALRFASYRPFLTPFKCSPKSWLYLE
ncbi:hypothetical protein PCANC_25406 [Puccinia coronata f. sp. avenae]|uniref:Uncharacterized protein n=1 Tax=Puccinia coronata f. sp. avenae TaxID=200324 RepID=A0A2N5TKW5_9BASI|nr:hypothetical protein PCANC_25406 [Puccinia coronata f. sp. avenae]